MSRTTLMVSLPKQVDHLGMTMPLETLPWDIADHLTNDDAIAAYLDACLDDGDPKLVAAALGDIARAKRLQRLAARTGLSAATLQHALNGDEVPAFATILKVVEALGLRLAARPKAVHAA